MRHDNATTAFTETVDMSARKSGIQFRILRDDPSQHYFLYLPSCMDAQVPVASGMGWYTFPDSTLCYPRGIKPRRDLPDMCFEPERFLRVPGSVVVGVRDIKPGTALNKATRVIEQQGHDRLMRAQRWTEAMNVAAHERGLGARYAVHTLPRCGHSFRRSMRRGMGKYVFEYLFGAVDGEH